MTLIFFPVKADIMNFATIIKGTFLGTFLSGKFHLKFRTFLRIFKVKIEFQSKI